MQQVLLWIGLLESIVFCQQAFVHSMFFHAHLTEINGFTAFTGFFIVLLVHATEIQFSLPAPFFLYFYLVFFAHAFGVEDAHGLNARSADCLSFFGFYGSRACNM